MRGLLPFLPSIIFWGLLPLSPAFSCGICGSLGISSSVVHDLSSMEMTPTPAAASGGPATGENGLTRAEAGGADLGGAGVSIQLVPAAGMQSNPAALAAFQRAVATWESFIADPITITIEADLLNMGSPTIIGSTQSVFLQGGFDLIRNAMVAAGAGDTLLASLPTFAGFSALVPDGFSLGPNLLLTKANAKALEAFGDLDAAFGARDGTIQFNSGFAFDYDRSDGISPGTMDFETAALHEIGHALGFISIVDSVDALVTANTPQAISPFVLDLFRFENNGGFDPATPEEFAAMPRLLAPGGNSIFDTLAHEWSLSTGVANGDGAQASHWIDGPPSLQSIGVMDPTLSFGQSFAISYADLRAFDLLGYDIIVPEPAPVGMLAIAATVGLIRRRRPT